MKLPRLTSVLVLALLLGPVTGCAYVKNRMLDMSDVLDIKYGYAVGVGVKAEVTNYVGVGLGYGVMTKTREWYGRKSHVAYDQEFLHFILAGRDGTKRDWGEPGLDGTDFYNMVLPINLAALDHDSPPMLQRWRVGFELVLPLANGGLYLNLGELADFVLGLATIDIAGDDGVPKSAQYNDNFLQDEDLPDTAPAPSGEADAS